MADDATREHLSPSQRPQDATFAFNSDVAHEVFGRWAEWASTYCRPAGGAILMIDITFRGDYFWCV